MPTIRNPQNTDKRIDLTPALENKTPAYGYFSENGLFQEQGIVNESFTYEVYDQEQPQMTALTSQTENDAVALAGDKIKRIALSTVSTRITDGVTSRDLRNVSRGIMDLRNESLQEAIDRKLTRMYNTGSANMEYLVATATQGIVRDPKDQSVVHDMFAWTGITQTTFPIDASPTADLLSQFTELANQLATVNGYNGSLSTIELVLDDAAFTNIVNHPDLSTAYQLAYQGTGAMAMANPYFNGTQNKIERTSYGFRRQFRWNNFLFTTYPQKFRTMQNQQVSLAAANEGWTVLHDMDDLYQVKYSPMEGFSTLGSVGQKWYATSTNIIEDRHIDMFLESHLIPFIQRPEVAFKVTVTA